MPTVCLNAHLLMLLPLHGSMGLFFVLAQFSTNYKCSLSALIEVVRTRAAAVAISRKTPNSQNIRFYWQTNVRGGRDGFIPKQAEQPQPDVQVAKVRRRNVFKSRR